MSHRHESIAVRLSHSSDVGEARRAARRSAEGLGFDEVRAEEAAIVATEAARNAVVHGGGGQVLLTPASGGRALDVLALDQGPGIADVSRAMQDGFSTVGTAGQGLGAVSRLASVFDLYSAAGRGTALLARLGAAREDEALDVGAVCVAMASEVECGDAWAIERPGGRLAVLVADGIGHGPRAAEAAHAAVASFGRHAALPAAAVVEHLHRALRPTRGAAVAVLELGVDGTAVRYAGVGNISGVLVGSDHARKMVSLAGTAGHEVRTIRAFDYAWPEDGVLVMHSDGVATHWELDGYPGLSARHPSLVAGVLYRDFSRGRDDATVVVVRRRHP